MTTTTAPTTPAGVLRAAADWLEQNPTRWGREFYVGENGCRCALGALALAADPDDEDGDPWLAGISWSAAEMLADYLVSECDVRDLRRFLGLERRSAIVNIVGDWNDADARTCADVVAMLRAAAKWGEHR